ncbi:hypothetical protein GGF31_005996 [Allomyces arbusculus]|nr:hypothetical protein GGF31_005996 [Allomyces arbusculus]
MVAMSSLVQSAPLTTVPASPSAAVALAINDPIFESSSERRRLAWADLLRRLHVLELCLTKHAQLATSPTSTPESIAANDDDITRLRHELDTAVRASSRALGGLTDVKAILGAAGLSATFPRVAETSPAPASAATSKPELRHMTVLNQVVALALQLREDVQLANHKYMAHQIALLYQSLTGAREDLRHHRTSIESRFDSIKASCSAPVPEPQLTQEQRQWLHDLTTQILTEALFSGKSLSASSAAMECLRAQ